MAGLTNGYVNNDASNKTNTHLGSHDNSNDIETPRSVASIPEPIAIVGMSMRFPGAIHTEEAFWNLLINKKTTRSLVPQSRYNYEGFYTETDRVGNTGVRHGHFLADGDGLDLLDTSFFNIGKAEAERLDPQQRMLLEVVWECMENAGQREWRGSNTGVFVGSWGDDWVDFLAKDPQNVGGMLNVTGAHDYAIANRVSYEYDLQGPSMVIKTACSSSMICLHQAVQALRNGECDAAIVAGTNLILTPTLTIAQTEAGMLSPTGECRTFDAAANGYGRGEAINALLLKRLSTAVGDKDTIRAVVRSTAVNCDGRSAGFTTPRSKAHIHLMKQAYKAGGLKDPSETPYVEVHGTGTKIGDPIELEAIAEVFGGTRDTYIGGVKANIGHGESASGVSSIIKAVLALEKRIIPPQANFTTPNPKIPFAESRLVVPLGPTPWPEGRPERVSVNSFGITGANAHAVIESAASYKDTVPELTTNGDHKVNNSQLLLISAANAQSLKKRCQQIQDYAVQHPNQLSHLAYTLACRRDYLSYRAYYITTGPSSFTEVITSDRPKQVPKLNLVFTGQGAQWPAMGRELIETLPSYRKDITQLGMLLERLPHPPSWKLMDELLYEGVKSRINKAELSQPLCTAIQIALVNLLKLLGLIPATVVGHSSGEIGAAYAAGAVTAEEAMAIAYYRGLITTMSSRKGAMAAVGISRAEATLYLEDGVSIACDNSPQSTTLSGDEEALGRIIEQVKADDPTVFARHLRTDGMAYHSHHMIEIGSLYEKYLMPLVKGRSPKIDFFSTVTGRWFRDKRLGPQYWRQNLASPVRFFPAVKSIIEGATSDQLFLEIGPHSALAGPLRQIFKASSSKVRLSYCPSLVRNKDARECILDMCGKLYLQTIPLSPQILTIGSHLLIDLPNYPWHHSSHWAEHRAVRRWRERRFPLHELLGSPLLEGNDFNPTWRNMLRLKDALWLQDHKIYDEVVFPCAGYIAMAGEAIRQLSETDSFIIRNLEVKAAMVLQDEPVEITTSLSRLNHPHEPDQDWYGFTIVSHNGSLWTEHCTGEVRVGKEEQSIPAELSLSKALPRKIRSPYNSFQSLGLHHGPAFQGLEDLSVMPGQRTAVATLKTATNTGSPYALHPTTIDQCLQLLAMASCEGLSRQLKRIPLPTRMKQVVVRRSKPRHRLRTRSIATHISNQGDIEGEVVVTEGSIIVLVVDGCQLSAFEGQSVIPQDDQTAVGRLSWRPHINFVPLNTLMVPHSKNSNDVKVVEEYGLLCTAEIQERIKDTKESAWQLTRFRKWMNNHITAGHLGQNELVSNSKELLTLSSERRMELIYNLREKLTKSQFVHVTELITRLLDNCVGIFKGTTEVLEAYLKDDALTKFYALTGDRIDASEFFVTAGHTTPALRVLEIGAGTGGTTLVALKALTSINNEPLYSSYTFTDISSGFFTAAKDRFKEFPGLKFKTLDISKCPAQQGFELGTYDFIIASNVLHATSCINTTLKNVHNLLSPVGRLFLQELIPTAAKMINIIMGPLPGWWLGEADGREDEPIISLERWNSELCAAGFSGIEYAVRDDHHKEFSIGANIIAKPAVDAQDFKSVTLLVKSSQTSTNTVNLMKQALNSKDYSVDICTLEDAIPPHQDIISLLDVSQPFFVQVKAEDIATFQKTLAGMTSARMLWVMGSAQIEPINAQFGLALGVIRCIRAETSICLATVEIDKFDDKASETILKVFENFLDTASEVNPDLEYAIHDGVVKVGRYHWSNACKELEALQDISGLPLRLAVESTDASSLVKWVPQCEAKLQPDEVSVCSIYVRTSLKDFHSTEENSARNHWGRIVQVGTEIRDLKAGDAVMVLGHHRVQTSFHIHARNVIRLPDSLDLEEAATMELAYATALHCLRNLARLQKNRKVLITSPSSDVGLAAIQICHMLNANPYCLTNNDEEARFLSNEIAISNDSIITSHSSSVVNRLVGLDGKGGFDVVLCVSSQDLSVSCKYAASRGKIINVGGRFTNESLDPGLFTGNRTFFNVDTAEMDDLYPELLQEIISLYQQNKIKPVKPSRVIYTQDLEAILRSLNKQDSLETLLLKMPTDPGSLSISLTPPILQFRSDASYLIAGDLGGLGRTISTCMAEHGARHFTYLSRSASSNLLHQSFFGELEAQGCTILALPCDLSHLPSVHIALRQIPLPIAGVLHMSMLLADGSFLTMNHSDWTAATGAKVAGTWNLHSALLDAGRNAELDFFIMFSSISGPFGSPHQANYAPGNTFQDAFVQYRHSLGLPASVLNIGAMRDVEYVSENNNAQECFLDAEMPFISEDELWEVVKLSILQQRPLKDEAPREAGAADPGFTSRSQLALGLRTTKLMADPTIKVLWKGDRRMDIYRNIEAARMCNSATAAGSPSDAGKEDGIGKLMASLRASADPGSLLGKPETLKLVTHEIGVVVYESMLKGVEEEDMEFGRSLMTLGVDSLVTIEVRNRLRRKLEVELSTPEMLSAGTIANLGELAVERMKWRFAPAQNKAGNKAD